MDKKRDFSLLALIAVMFTTICMETDIYVPSFPDMKVFFQTSSDAIQHVLSINFIGIFIGSLLFGPLSDSLGRQKTLRLGLCLFALASWGCILCTDYTIFLFCRFIQGIGAATPMVISFAIILEKYEPKKVAQLCGGLNLFITGMMAVAPLIGSFLNLYYGWQYNFILIACLASCSLLGSFFYIPETLSLEKRISFSIPKVLSNYSRVLKSFPYMAAAFICYLMFAGLILFTANLSLIFIENLGVSKEIYGFYQASAPAAFALFSLLSIWIIGYFGTEKTKWAGIFTVFVGATLFMLTALVNPSPLLICAAMIIFTAGITLAGPIYGTESANVFPEMRGIATGMSNALRHLIVAGMVSVGSYNFNGSIKPVASLILIATAFTIFFALA
ncbi:MFS transporter [Legionella sp. km772]|uniref:MFS transporter n=1 Tax=Legionella sp. km772 TaxID=2498111 RepID=UPI000F8D91EA|nr:MFS transporter [Legionella sp. km772]RUR06805.1 MFS transporter [Legionella sp. km772]